MITKEKSELDQLRAELEGKTLEQAIQIKKYFFILFCGANVEKIAWSNGNPMNGRPVRPSQIRVQLVELMRREFSDLFDGPLCFNTAKEIADEYY